MEIEVPVLSSALLDNHRRFLRFVESRVGDRALAEDILQDAFVRELERERDRDADTDREICACVTRVAGTLKPEYADALQQIEIGGASLKAYAAERGLTPGNAGVRVHRARQALKARLTESCGLCAEHGCVDCTCGS